MNARASAVLLACIGVALAFGIVARSAGVPGPSFRLTNDFSTGTDCEAFAIGDLNGDHRTDIAVGCGAVFGGLAVYFNRGSGRFREGGEYLTEDENHAYLVTSVAIGDLDGDGTADVAAAFSGLTGSLAVLLNRGDGTLLPSADYHAGKALSVALGDLNGDGKLDLVTGKTSAVSVLLNRGDGTFMPAVGYPAGRGGYWGARDVVVGDVDGDGTPDLVTQNDKAGTVSVLLNRGDGTFLPKRDVVTERHPSSLVLGDLNGDGRPDIVTAGLRSGRESDGAISVLFNRGGGTFGRRRDYRILGFGLAVGDLNGDGSLDLATTSARGVSVLLNGGGGLKGRLDYATGGADGAVTVATADVNGDGRLDLAAANTTVLRNDAPSDLGVLINAPGLCNVQFVKGLTLTAARRKLARVNCRAGKVSGAYSKRVKTGLVISQKPKFGAVLRAGGKVNVVISRGRKR